MVSLSKNWNSLIKPALKVVEDSQAVLNTSTIIVEPLERGFGVTLGNSLRRIFLSSIPGYAVTKIRINNVTHEYSCSFGSLQLPLSLKVNLRFWVFRALTHRKFTNNIS